MSDADAPGPVSGSPRPSFDGPALIRRTDVTRHVWGEPESGEVFDWIYASTEQVHALVFGVAPGGSFRHSDGFRTVFGADEVLHVLEGTLVLCDPETGEVQKVPRGGQVTFGKDTWHHAFALGPDPLRVLELFAPPPAAGASSAYARSRPYLEPADWRYADDAQLGNWPPAGNGAAAAGAAAAASAAGAVGAAAARAPRLRVVGPGDVLWRRDLGVLCGVLLSTPQLTVLLAEVGPGEVALAHAHAGDELLFALDGPLWVRVWHGGAAHVFELGAEDAVWIPEGAHHEYRNPGAGLARALIAVAPDARPPAPGGAAAP